MADSKVDAFQSRDAHDRQAEARFDEAQRRHRVRRSVCDVGQKTEPLEHPLDRFDVTERVELDGQNPFFGGHVFEARAFFGGVAERKNERERLAVQRSLLDFGRGEAVRDEADFEFVAQDFFENLAVRCLKKLHFDARHRLVDLPNEARDDRLHGRRGVADAPFDGLASMDFGGLQDRFVKLKKQPLGFFFEKNARRREPDLLLRAIEKFGADLFLELLDLAAEGGLGDQNSFGGFSKIEVFCDDQKIPKLREMHGFVNFLPKNWRKNAFSNRSTKPLAMPKRH